MAEMDAAQVVAAQVAAASASGVVNTADKARMMQEIFKEAAVLCVSLPADADTYLLLTNMLVAGELNVDFISAAPQKAAVGRVCMHGVGNTMLLEAGPQSTDEDIKVLHRRHSVKLVLAVRIAGGGATHGSCAAGVLYVGLQKEPPPRDFERLVMTASKVAQLTARCLASQQHSDVMDRLRQEGLLGPPMCPVCKGVHSAATSPRAAASAGYAADTWSPQRSVDGTAQQQASDSHEGHGHDHSQGKSVQSLSPVMGLPLTHRTNSSPAGTLARQAGSPGNGQHVDAAVPFVGSRYNHAAILEYIRSHPKEHSRRRSRKSATNDTIPAALPVYQHDSCHSDAPQVYESVPQELMQRHSKQRNKSGSKPRQQMPPSPFESLTAGGRVPYDPTPQHLAAEFSGHDMGAAKRRALSMGAMCYPGGMQQARSWSYDTGAANMHNAPTLDSQLSNSSRGKRRYMEDSSMQNLSGSLSGLVDGFRQLQPVPPPKGDVSVQRYRTRSAHLTSIQQGMQGMAGLNTAMQPMYQDGLSAPSAGCAQTMSNPGFAHQIGAMSGCHVQNLPGVQQVSSGSVQGNTPNTSPSYVASMRHSMQQQQQQPWLMAKGSTDDIRPHKADSVSPTTPPSSQAPSPIRHQLSRDMEDGFSQGETDPRLPTQNVPCHLAHGNMQGMGPGSVTYAPHVRMYHSSSVVSQQEQFAGLGAVHMQAGSSCGPPTLTSPSLPDRGPPSHMLQCQPGSATQPEPDAAQLQRLTLEQFNPASYQYLGDSKGSGHHGFSPPLLHAPMAHNGPVAMTDASADNMPLLDASMPLLSPGPDSLMGTLLTDFTEAEALDHLAADAFAGICCDDVPTNPVGAADEFSLLWCDSGPVIPDTVDVFASPHMSCAPTQAPCEASATDKHSGNNMVASANQGNANGHKTRKQGIFSSFTARVRSLKSGRNAEG